MKNFANKIARLCYEKYNSLKKTGKPKHNEWTVLAGVVLKNVSSDEYLSVISLATGTKCLSGTELLSTKSCECGSRLSDSHAEILARRAFLRYLYHQLNITINNNDSEIFYLDVNKKINLKSNISFHYFCSQTPCGDCSIIPKTYDNTNVLIDTSVRKRKIHTSTEIEVKRCSLREDYQSSEFNDVHRTGAKCVESERYQDSHLPGINYHVVGPLRTKPGRGDRTLSLSCSDKMAKWNAVGIQGALLSRLIPPIRMDSFCIGGQCPFSLDAMRRGICGRFTTSTDCPVIMQSEHSFIHRKDTARIKPCPSSVIWCAVNERQLEISVDGRRQGATKKNIRQNYLLISRQALYRTFLKTLDKINNMTSSEWTHPKKVTYFHAKHSSMAYQQLWKSFKFQGFQAWPTKPSHLQDFVLTS